MHNLDETHSPARTSWVETANGHAECPIQNLPFGRFTDGGEPRLGVAIGDMISDLRACAGSGLLDSTGALAVDAVWQSTQSGSQRSIR